MALELPPDTLEVAARAVGGRTVLTVAGEVDVYTAPILREQLDLLADAQLPGLVVDLSRVEFLDSTGVGVLLGAVKRAHAAGGTLTVCGLRDHPEKIFRILGLARILAILPTLADALADENGARR